MKFPVLGTLWALLTQPIVENEYWTDYVTEYNTLDRRLTHEDEIKAGIDQILDELDVREGEYLFGSVEKTKDKTHYRGEIKDVDIHIWISKNVSGKEKEKYWIKKDCLDVGRSVIEIRIEDLLKQYFSCPIDCRISKSHPFDLNNERTLLSADISSLTERVYPLYQHPDYTPKE